MKYIHSAIVGAVGGDIAGSCYEFDRNSYKGTLKSLEHFEILPEPYPWARNMRIALTGENLKRAYEQKVRFATDDSILTIGGVGKAVLEYKNDPKKDLAKLTANALNEIACQYPYAGWGGNFQDEFMNPHSPSYKRPYNSMGNGAAMRVSAAGFAADSLAEAEKMGETVTAVTHNHSEGIKSGKVIAGAVYLAKSGASKDQILQYCAHYYPELTDPNYTLDYCRNQRYSELAPVTVPMALAALRDANSYEEVIKNAIYIGGDTDTIGSILGGIAGALFGVPEHYYNRIMGENGYLDNTLRNIATQFESKFQPKIVEVQNQQGQSFQQFYRHTLGQSYSGTLYQTPSTLKFRQRDDCCISF